MPPGPIPTRFARFAWVVLVFNVLVILWGAFVRATGSGAGCGSHWPTCNGEGLPAIARVATAIEFGHRASSGVAAILVVVMCVWAFRAFPKGSPVRRGALLSLIFIAGEVAIGAMLVLLKLVELDASVMRGASIALHLANTFLLLGALGLTVFWGSGGGELRVRGQGATMLSIGGVLLAMVLVGISGAIAALGDTLYPAQGSLTAAIRDDFTSGAPLFQRLRVVHPFLAMVTAGVTLLATQGVRVLRPSPSVRRASRWVVVMVVAQVGLGFLNVALKAPVPMQLAHLLLADLTWLALVWLAAHALSTEARPATSSPAHEAPARR